MEPKDDENGDGDTKLYESRLSGHDELTTLNDTLDRIREENDELHYRMLSGVTDQSALNKFEKVMHGLDELIGKEEALEKKLQAQAIERAQK